MLKILSRQLTYGDIQLLSPIGKVVVITDYIDDKRTDSDDANLQQTSTKKLA